MMVYIAAFCLLVMLGLKSVMVYLSIVRIKDSLLEAVWTNHVAAEFVVPI